LFFTILVIKVKVILRPTISRPVSPGVRSPSGPVTNFSFSLKFLQTVASLLFCGALSDERIHCCFWALPEQSLSGPSPAELTTLFYCLIWDSPNLEVEVEVKLRPTVGRPVHLGVRHPSGSCNQFFFLLEIFFRQLQVCHFVASSLMRGWVCNLLLMLVLTSASCSGPSPTGLKAIFYCLNFETPQPGGPCPCIYIPQEQGSPVIPLGTGFPFGRLLRLAGLRWRYSIPPPHGIPTSRDRSPYLNPPGTW
jgi:hypothetical protein